MAMEKDKVCDKFLLPGLKNNEIIFLSVDRELITSHPNIKIAQLAI